MKRSEIEAVLAEHPTAVFAIGTSRYAIGNSEATISGFEQVRKSRYGSDGSKVTVAVTHRCMAGYRDHDAEEYTWVRDPTIDEKGTHERLGQITHVLANSFDEWVDETAARYEAAMEVNREQADRERRGRDRSSAPHRGHGVGRPCQRRQGHRQPHAGPGDACELSRATAYCPQEES